MSGVKVTVAFGAGIAPALELHAVETALVSDGIVTVHTSATVAVTTNPRDIKAAQTGTMDPPIKIIASVIERQNLCAGPDRWPR